MAETGEAIIAATENQKKYEIDMTQGALLGNVVRFAIPLVLTGILQLLFNAVDMIVIGHFAGARSLAAVGSTMSLIHLNTTLAMGLSLGASVAISKQFGAQDFKQMSKTVHTAVTLSLIAGVVVSVVGLSLTLPMLRFMNSPEDVIDLSAKYLRIIFIGAPASMIYNFSSAILRAVGDTKRPMYFLAIAGVLNVVLNLFFVIVLKMDVAGVALGTIISTSLSAFISVRALIKHPRCSKTGFIAAENSYAGIKANLNQRFAGRFRGRTFCHNQYSYPVFD